MLTYLFVGGSEGGSNIKTEGGKGGGGGPVNQNSSISKPKHINNVSVIQCGPALVNANQVKVKAEPSGPLILPPPTIENAVDPLMGLDKIIDKQKPLGDKIVDNQKQEVKKPPEKQKPQELNAFEQLAQEGSKTLQSLGEKSDPQIAHVSLENKKSSQITTENPKLKGTGKSANLFYV